MNTVPFGEYGDFTSISGNGGALSSLTATIDKPEVAYLVAASATELWVVPIDSALPADGGTSVVNVTFNGKSQNGTVLPSLTVALGASDAPAPPQATSINSGNFATHFIPNPAPANPGTATVTLI